MDILRPAGFNERRCIVRDSLKLYGSIVTVGTYYSSLPGHKVISRDDTFIALKACITQHTVLGVVVQDAESDRPQLARLSQIDRVKHVVMLDVSDTDDDKAIQRLLEKVHNQPFDEAHVRPQWRVYLLPVSAEPAQRFHLAFACSHSLTDGMSGFVFHKTFLQALRDVRALGLGVTPVFNTPSAGQVLPPLDRAGRFTISWSFLLAPLLAEYMPTLLARAVGMKAETTESNTVDRAWYGASVRPERSRPLVLIPTAVVFARVPHEVVQRVVYVCRSHSSRLTGLLIHVVAKALARALHIRGHDYRRFATGTAIDMRRCLELDQQECMANYVSAVSEVVNVDMKSLEDHALTDADWEAVQRTTKLLSQRSRTLADQPIALLKYLSNYRGWTHRNAEAPAKASFEVSNLGALDAGTQNKTENGTDWTIEEMAFSQSADGTGAPLSFNVASAKTGSLSIVVTWWPGMLGVDDERTFAQEISSDIVSWLKALSE